MVLRQMLGEVHQQKIETDIKINIIISVAADFHWGFAHPGNSSLCPRITPET